MASALAGAILAAGPVGADKQIGDGDGGSSQIIDKSKGGTGQSDHALYGGGDTAIYCGVALNEFVEPWTLHLSASAGLDGGRVTITFNDNDAITFRVPDGGSFNMTQALGGVPGVTDGEVNDGGVDDLVRITADGAVDAMMASAHVLAAATDPFDETLGGGTAEPDNFCLTAPNDPGANWAAAHFPAP